MEIHSTKIPSQCLKRDIPVNIVLPDRPAGKWMLLLHGYRGDQNEWLTKSSVADLANQYGISLVAPACGDGYYLDTQEPMGCFLGEELPAFLRANFPVSSDAFILGSSMGGFGSLLLGARYSNVYGKIVSLGGAFIIHDICIGNPEIVHGADINYFKRVFGDFQTLEHSERDPLCHAQNAVKENRMSPVLLFCGTNDLLYRSNKRMRKELHKLGVPVKNDFC